MTKYIHNITDEEKTYQGRVISAGSFFQIPSTAILEFQADSQLLADLANLTIKMSADGITDFTGSGSQHIDFLKDVLDQRDTDGAILSRAKITQSGWSYQLIAWEVETAKNNGITAKDHNNLDINYFTYKMYDSNGAVTTTDADCTKTVVDFEPPFDYEIVGGSVYQKEQPTTNIHYHCIAVPDVPEAYGGTKVFIRNVDLSYVPAAKGLDSDGRAPKRLAYSDTYHTNKLRFVLNHGAGVQHKFMQVIELFRP